MKTLARSVTTICSSGVLLLSFGCEFLGPRNCPPPATGQIHWYQNNGVEATCDDVAGFDLPKDVPPGQDGRFTAGCPTEGRFEANGPLVVDTCTGLTWQRTPPSGTRSWVQALVFARDLELGGFDDWRLPNVNELLTLVDYGRDQPAINPVFDVPSGDDVAVQNVRTFWSSTSDNLAPQTLAWAVAFTFGNHIRHEKLLLRSARAVRDGFLPRKAPVFACELLVSP